MILKLWIGYNADPHPLEKVLLFKALTYYAAVVLFNLLVVPVRLDNVIYMQDDCIPQK